MNAAVQEVSREINELLDRINGRDGIATRAEKRLLRAMKDRLELARKGITA